MILSHRLKLTLKAKPFLSFFGGVVVLKDTKRRFVCKVTKMKDILSSIRSTRKRPKHYDEAVAFKEKRTRELPSELRGGTSRIYVYVFVFVD